MKPLEKIAEEKAICTLLFNKNRTKVQDYDCYRLLKEYQAKYSHPFPISVIDKYMEKK